MTLFDVMILLLGATMLAVSAWLASTRPNVIRRSAQSLSSLLLALWLLDCLIGIVIQAPRGTSVEAVTTSSSVFDEPHRLLSYAVVIALWLTAFSAASLAVERAIRAGAALRLILQAVVGSVAFLAVLLSSFTGYLREPAANASQHDRFIVLHVVIIPVVGTVALVLWRFLLAGYSAPPGDTAGASLSREESPYRPPGH